MTRVVVQRGGGGGGGGVSRNSASSAPSSANSQPNDIVTDDSVIEGEDGSAFQVTASGSGKSAVPTAVNNENEFVLGEESNLARKLQDLDIEVGSDSSNLDGEVELSESSSKPLSGRKVPNLTSSLPLGAPISDPAPSSSETVLVPRAISHEETDAGCSIPLAPPPPSMPLPSSRRSGWVGCSAMNANNSRGPSSRRKSITLKGTRISPNSSRPTSPKSYGEGDGYNSADEHNPWTPGPSGYKDGAERERQFEKELRRVKGLEVKHMAEDGNCLFRAVADRVYGDTEMYDETRQMCIDYMEKERDHFSQFVTESFTAYCKRKRRDKVYGNNLEIQAMAEIYNRPIHIYSYSTEPINTFHGSYETDLPPIRLSYHRGNHYNSIVDPCNPAVGVGLGFGSLRGRNIEPEQVKAALNAQQEQQIDKVLLAEGRYYSDMELTEQEIERMVMEASRAEYLAGESRRAHNLWQEETSTSAGAEPSSSRATGSPRKSSGNEVTDRRASVLTAATTTESQDSSVLSENVRTLLFMGFSYLRVMEAHSIFGDNINNMLCYLLETEAHGSGAGENIRRKGKAAE